TPSVAAVAQAKRATYSRSPDQSGPLRLRFLFHLQDISPKPVEFLVKPRLGERVVAVGEFQSNICPVLWPQRVECRWKHDALLHGHVLPFVVDEVADRKRQRLN